MGKQWIAGIVTIILGGIFGLVLVGPPGNDSPTPLLRAEGSTTLPLGGTEATEAPATTVPEAPTTTMAKASSPESKTVPTAPPFPAKELKSGASGPDVRTWQQQMRKRGWQISTDGQYGPSAVAVCSAFQRQKGLNPSGVVDEATWDAAWTAPLPDDTKVRGS
jgi:peptidoglycan hydrolase-like protein with peptidoglycan-binding domain